MSFGLVKGQVLRRPSIAVGGLEAQFQCRLFLLDQALIFGGPVDAPCLSALPGGRGRFMPCCFGANHCRLRHVGWESLGMVLPLGQTSSVSFLNELLVIFGYPPRSGAALLGGHLPFRHCVTTFACRIPTWKLAVDGSVAGLLAEYGSGGHALCIASAPGSGPTGRGSKKSSTRHKKTQRVRFFGSAR